MTIPEFQEKAKEAGYEDFPIFHTALEVSLADFINYNDATLELKTYLSKHILCKCFYGTYMAWHRDVKWLIDGFFNSYSSDLIKPELSSTIKEAVTLITSNDPFTKQIFGTCFMFGVIEFYAKYELGFRPNNYDFFDWNKKDYIKQYNPKFNPERQELSISSALKFLQQKDTPISKALNEIDAFTTEKLQISGIESERWIKYTISERISIARNTMLHGERHSFSNMGYYLIVLYTLFHLHRTTN